MDIFLIRVPYVNLRHTQLFDLVESIQTKQSSNPNALKRVLGTLRSWFVVFIPTLSSERNSKQVPALFSYRRNHRVERLVFHQAHRHWASIRSKFTLDPHLSNTRATSRSPSTLPHRARPPGNMHQIKPITSSHPAKILHAHVLNALIHFPQEASPANSIHSPLLIQVYRQSISPDVGTPLLLENSLEPLLN